MRKILAALLVGFVALGTIAIAAPVSNGEEVTPGNVGFIAFTADSTAYGWVKYTQEAGSLITSWHVLGLAEGTYDLYAVVPGYTEPVLVYDDAVAAVESTDDFTSTYAHIELATIETVLDPGTYTGIIFQVWSQEGPETGALIAETPAASDIIVN